MKSRIEKKMRSVFKNKREFRNLLDRLRKSDMQLQVCDSGDSLPHRENPVPEMQGEAHLNDGSPEDPEPITVIGYTEPLKELVAPALLGFIREEARLKSRRADAFQMEWTAPGLVRKTIQYLFDEDAVTEREKRTLVKFLNESDV